MYIIRTKKISVKSSTMQFLVQSQKSNLLSNRTSRQRQLPVEVMDDNYHEGDSVLSKINCADSDQCDPLAIVHYCARL